MGLPVLLRDGWRSPAHGFALVFLGMAHVLLASVLLAADLILALADVALLVSLHFVRETGEVGD